MDGCDCIVTVEVEWSEGLGTRHFYSTMTSEVWAETEGAALALFTRNLPATWKVRDARVERTEHQKRRDAEAAKAAGAQ